MPGFSQLDGPSKGVWFNRPQGREAEVGETTRFYAQHRGHHVGHTRKPDKEQQCAVFLVAVMVKDCCERHAYTAMVHWLRTLYESSCRYV